MATNEEELPTSTDTKEVTNEERAKWTQDAITESDRAKWTQDAFGAEATDNHITNNLALTQEPDEGIVKSVSDVLFNASYYTGDLDKGIIKGIAKAGTSTVKLLADVYEAPDMRRWMDDANKYLDETFATHTGAGEVGDVVGRVGAGIVATGGLGVATIPARMAQGFLIDLFAFEGDSGNIANVLDEHNVELGGLVEALKSDPTSPELENRLKNALSGALIGGALETTVAGFKYGASLIKSKNIELVGTDAEKLKTVIDTLKEDASELSKVKSTANVAEEVVDTVPSKVPVKNDSAFTLAGNLQEAKLNYNYGQKSSLALNFETDFDKAVYIASNPKASAQQKAYKDALTAHGVDAETITTLGTQLRNAIKSDARKMSGEVDYTVTSVARADAPEEVVKKATIARVNEGAELYKMATDLIKDVPDNFDELASRGKDLINKNDPQTLADDIVKWADGGILDEATLTNNKLFQALDGRTKESLISSIGKDTFFTKMEKIQSGIKSGTIKLKDIVDDAVDLKSPLNAEKITPSNKELLAKTTQHIRADADFISHNDLLAKANKDLEKDLGKEGFDLVKDLTDTADKVSTLSLKVTQARLVVGNLTQKFQEALIVAQKEGGSEATVRAMMALDNLVATSKILKNVTSSVAKSMSAMRINPEEAHLFNSLKIMDNIDTDYSMSLLRQAMADGNEPEIIKIMEALSDTTNSLKKHVESYQDGLFTKTGNILSEGGIANMLSSPSTLAVNIVGNSYMKHQKVLQDALQYVTGKVLNSADRMKSRELRYLMNSVLLDNVKHDLPKVGTNIKEWVKSGLDDDVIDESMLARYIQDQDHQRKYISSYYIRGKDAGSADTTFNTMINSFGKLSRVPYKTIGAVDDYYKRGAFRSQLIRVGSRLADARNIADDAYTEFIDKFIKANTEAHILRNNGHKMTPEFLKANKKYLTSGGDGLGHADEARDFANYMTMQKELDGVLKKGVDFLNSDGFLRILVPFKLTPINMLKTSLTTATDPIRQLISKDIKSGGIKRDIAIAKMAYSSSLMLGLGYLAQSGHLTGTFSADERVAMAGAGVPELSFRIGNTWYDYRQLEPIATIAGVMTDVYKLQRNIMLRKEDILSKDLENLQDEVGAFLSDVGMSIVGNIINKSYAKGMADSMSLMTGEGNLANYSGNLISSLVPMSSLANFVGRIAGDGYKKEALDFDEKILSKYRVFLERDALDAYGRPIKEIDYTPFLTKAVGVNKDDKGALEVARLGINLQKMNREVSYEGIKVELNADEYHDMRRSLDTDYHLADRLTDIVNSDDYKNADSDYIRAEILSTTINTIKLGASQAILAKPRVLNKIQEGVQVLSDKVNEAPKETFNNMIFGGINE